MSVEATNTERVQSMSEVLSTIDLGPTGSVQFRFAKLQMAQAELCKQQADSYMDKIEQIQADQEEVAKMIAEARDLQNQAKTGNTCTTMSQEMVDYFNKHGLTYDKASNDTSHNADQWDVAIKSLTNHQENIGTETQTLMVYLQDFIGQYNSYTQGASSQISSAAQTLTNLARGV